MRKHHRSFNCCFDPSKGLKELIGFTNVCVQNKRMNWLWLTLVLEQRSRQHNSPKNPHQCDESFQVGSCSDCLTQIDCDLCPVLVIVPSFATMSIPSEQPSERPSNHLDQCRFPIDCVLWLHPIRRLKESIGTAPNTTVELPPSTPPSMPPSRTNSSATRTMIWIICRNPLVIAQQPLQCKRCIFHFHFPRIWRLPRATQVKPLNSHSHIHKNYLIRHSISSPLGKLNKLSHPLDAKHPLALSTPSDDEPLQFATVDDCIEVIQNCFVYSLLKLEFIFKMGPSNRANCNQHLAGSPFTMLVVIINSRIGIIHCSQR